MKLLKNTTLAPSGIKKLATAASAYLTRLMWQWMLAGFCPALLALTLVPGIHGQEPVKVGQAYAEYVIAPGDARIVSLQPGEKIWSGVIKHGESLPYAAGSNYNFYANNRENQIQPLLLGSQGLCVWSEEPYAFEVTADRVILTQALGKIVVGRPGASLAEARRSAAAHFFPASGQMPDELLLARPQYNTWIELNVNQNEQDVLKYAHDIIDHGFPPGVLMIDDTWQENYGVWSFHPGKFPHPKAMMDELHRLGFKVMLWVCPFVSPDQSELVRKLMQNKCFLLQKATAQTTWETATDPAIIKWWDGYSALLDFSNPHAVRWFNEQLDRLVKEYGVDGFKFDAGDMPFYATGALSRTPNLSPNQQCELYVQFGLRYPLNEYRAGWKMAGKPLAQRLHDKYHTWEDAQRLIPQMLTEGLVGYTFSCPDMIGGGDFEAFRDLKKFDQDLIVRSAQIHALMPMMQFSLAPWRVLDPAHLAAVNRAVAIRTEFTPRILDLARKSAQAGEPIIHSLEYQFPHQGYEFIKDEFMLGDTVLVAPLDQKGTQRRVLLPPGEWVSDEGKTLSGGAAYELNVPLDRIPYFQLKNQSISTAFGRPAAPAAILANTYYVSSTSGNDQADGSSPTNAWRTLDRVNAAKLQPGDAVLFERDNLWRGELLPKSGAADRPVTYGAYGTGAKPLLQGSVAMSRAEDWVSEGNNLWVTATSSADQLGVDVGNIIFDHGVACGWKRWSREDLHQNADYWYDKSTHRVWLYSQTPPTTQYHSIELALRKHVVNESRCKYVTYENLHIRYGAAHGIGGDNTAFITVRRCDFSFIGGGLQFMDPKRGPIRFGNGVEFWNSARHNRVEDCRLWEIYDAALTNQGNGRDSNQIDVSYRNNIIWNSEYSFECWNRPESARLENIRFEGNTCINAGFGWGHVQRPDPNGQHLMFWDSLAKTQDVVVTGNIFFNSTDTCMRLGKGWRTGLTLSDNQWLQKTGPAFNFMGKKFAASQFDAFKNASGLDLQITSASPKP